LYWHVAADEAKKSSAAESEVSHFCSAIQRNPSAFAFTAASLGNAEISLCGRKFRL
jgi:hypothetical protein